MSSNIVFNGVTYSIPAEGDDNWGPDLTAYFIAIASSALQKTGGTFTLTAEAAFGATYGLKAPYFKSYGTNPAAAGVLRLANTQSVSWRNNANSADLALTSNASDALLFNSKNVLFSGLALIVNADVNASAAIAVSKLAAVTASKVLVSDGSGFVSASAVTSTTLSYLDATSSIQTQLNLLAPKASPTFTGTIVTPVTASRAVISNGSNQLAASATTDTELGYVSGVTSAIQTQMNLKAPLASPTFTGTMTVPATITAPSAVVVTLPTTTSTLATLGLTETVTGAKTMQNLTVTTNPITLTSGQIAFPATQLASANVNTLDDYEEGTFTSTIVGTSTAGVGTYSIQIGYYTKIGNMVFVTGYIVYSAHTGTGNGQIGGLPFTSTSTTNFFSSWNTGYFGNYALTAANVPMLSMSTNAVKIDINQMPSGGGAIVAAPIDVAANVMFSGFYIV